MNQHQIVLIADDNRDAADSLALCLNLTGHEAHTAYDGEDALSKARSLNPHVMVLDLAMPKLSGYELAKRIRYDSGFKETLLVAVSGYSDAAHQVLSDEAGFDMFFAKPVDPDMLHTILQTRWARQGHQEWLRTFKIKA